MFIGNGDLGLISNRAEARSAVIERPSGSARDTTGKIERDTDTQRCPFLNLRAEVSGTIKRVRKRASGYSDGSRTRTIDDGRARTIGRTYRIIGSSAPLRLTDRWVACDICSLVRRPIVW